MPVQPVGGGGVVPVPTLSNRFGEPEPGLETTLGVALATSWLRTCAGVQPGLALATRAAAPTTWGVAIEVPLIVLVAVLLVYQAEVIDEPGAKMSRQVPMLENDDRASVLVVEPTVMASVVRAA